MPPHRNEVRTATPSRALAWAGLGSASFSAAALWWRARRDLAQPLAPFNAPSHWLWGDRALRQYRPSWRYTGVGALTHVASSVFWAALYDQLRRRHPRAVADAATTSAIAACVDLLVVPKRLTLGFERQLSKRSLGWFYAAFALGLAVGGIAAERRSSSRAPPIAGDSRGSAAA